MLVSTRNKFDIARLKEMLSSEFDMNELIGSGRKILGMEINRDRAIGKLFLTHKSYIEKIFSQFGMEKKSKPLSMPTTVSCKLSLSISPQTKELAYMSIVRNATLLPV